jgi:hypothetical protein
VRLRSIVAEGAGARNRSKGLRRIIQGAKRKEDHVIRHGFPRPLFTRKVKRGERERGKKEVEDSRK